jgi:hypothetical protein
MDTFLAFAIPICTILLGLSAFFDKWAKSSQRSIYAGRPLVNTSFLDNTQFKLFWFCLFTILSILFNHCQSQRADQKVSNEIEKRDLANRKHLDSTVTATRDTTVSVINELLAPHHLIYDSSRNKIDTTKLISPEITGFNIRSSKFVPLVSDTSYSNSVIVTNTGNCPILFTFKIYVAVQLKQKFEFQNTHVGCESCPLAQGTSLEMPQNGFYDSTADKYCFLFIGNYTTGTGTLPKPIDLLWIWDFKTKSLGIPINTDTKRSIEDVIKRKFHL